MTWVPWTLAAVFAVLYLLTAWRAAYWRDRYEDLVYDEDDEGLSIFEGHE